MTVQLKLRPNPGKPELIRKDIVAHNAKSIIAGTNDFSENTIVLYNNIPAEYLSENDKKNILKKNHLAKQSEEYTILHEEHHLHNALAAPNLSSLNFVYRFMAGLQDEVSSMVNETKPNHNTDWRDVLLSAHINIVQFAEDYWNQTRSRFVLTGDNVCTPLRFQRDLYNEMLRYYYTFNYPGAMVNAMDVAGKTIYSLQNDIMWVFAARETVDNPLDTGIYKKIVKPNSKKWLEHAKKIKSGLHESGNGLEINNHFNIPGINEK